MCIVFYTVTQPGYKLILASNRDEYLDRPTAPADWHTFAPLSSEPLASSVPARAASDHPERPWVISGRDRGSPVGGTWLGLTRDLRLAVLTNIRIPPVPTPANPPSRGLLLKEFLAPPAGSLRSIQEYLEGYKPVAEQYEGFNLLLFHLHPTPRGDGQTGWKETEIGYLTNRPVPTLQNVPVSTSTPSNVVGECKGLSNTPMDQPWPKVTRGEAEMTRTLREWANQGEEQDGLVERMMEMLQQSTPRDSIADLSECTCLHPVTVGTNEDGSVKEGEKGRWYGTRVSTVILVKDDGEVTFVERDIFVQNSRGEAVRGDEERRFRFRAQPL